MADERTADANPYGSPTAADSAPARPPQPGFSIKAIVLGFLADIVSTVVMGTVFGIVAAMMLVARNGPQTPQEIAEALSSSWMYVIQVVLGIVGTVLGGFVTAWLSPGWPLKNACTMGCASTVWGAAYYLVMFAIGGAAKMNGLAFVNLVIVIPAAALGGYLQSKTRRK